jgi:hypothetical protein
MSYDQRFKVGDKFIDLGIDRHDGIGVILKVLESEYVVKFFKDSPSFNKNLTRSFFDPDLIPLTPLMEALL